MLKVSLETLPADLHSLTPEQLLALRDRAKSDKLFLANAVLGYSFQPDVHQELFDALIQYDSTKPWYEQSPIRKRLILWPRGHYKSTAIIVDIIQAILNFPDIRILIMQGALKNTRKLLKEIASHFTGQAMGSRLADLFPEFCTRDEKNPKTALHLIADQFTTPARRRNQLKEPTVLCASPNSVKTGLHFEILFADDLVNDKNYRSLEQLEKVREQFEMCIPLIDPPHYVVITGTRYAHTDLYGHIIRQNVASGEWTISVRTCWLEDGVTPRFTARELPDGRIIGFTREGLLQLQKNDPAMFAGQYLNQPITSNNQIFDEAMLDARVIIPAMAPRDLYGPYMFVDLASGGAYSDDCVILLGKTDHLGKMYVTFCRGGQWDSHTLASHIIDVIFRMCPVDGRPLAIYLEKSAAGKVFVDFLRMFASARGIQLPLIDFLPADNQPDAKRIRVEALKAYFSQARLSFFAGLEAWEKMKDQFIHFDGLKGTRDDYPDTVALMAAFFARNIPLVKPLSDYRIPFLKAIEMAGQQQDFQPVPEPASTLPYDGMGDYFAS